MFGVRTLEGDDRCGQLVTTDTPENVSRSSVVLGGMLVLSVVLEGMLVLSIVLGGMLVLSFLSRYSHEICHKHRSVQLQPSQKIFGFSVRQGRIFLIF